MATQTKWKTSNISAFFVSIGGLSTSAMMALGVLMSSYQHFAAEKSMFKRLYGEEAQDRKSGSRCTWVRGITRSREFVTIVCLFDGSVDTPAIFFCLIVLLLGASESTPLPVDCITSRFFISGNSLITVPLTHCAPLGDSPSCMLPEENSKIFRF